MTTRSWLRLMRRVFGGAPMSTGRRQLALFAVALVAVFAVAYGVAAVAVPDSVVHSWNQRAHDSHGGGRSRVR